MNCSNKMFALTAAVATTKVEVVVPGLSDLGLISLAVQGREGGGASGCFEHGVDMYN